MRSDSFSTQSGDDSFETANLDLSHLGEFSTFTARSQSWWSVAKVPHQRSPVREAPLLLAVFLVLLPHLLCSVSAFSVPVPGMPGPANGPAKSAKCVAVIGGGPVGIEAAVHLVDAGFSVTVCSTPEPLTSTNFVGEKRVAWSWTRRRWRIRAPPWR